MCPWRKEDNGIARVWQTIENFQFIPVELIIYWWFWVHTCGTNHSWPCRHWKRSSWKQDNWFHITFSYLRASWIRAFHCWGAIGFEREATLLASLKLNISNTVLLFGFIFIIRWQDVLPLVDHYFPGFPHSCRCRCCSSCCCCGCSRKSTPRCPCSSRRTSPRHRCFQPAHRGRSSTWLVHALLTGTWDLWDAFTLGSRLYLLIWTQSLSDAFSDVSPWPRALQTSILPASAWIW